MRVKIHVTRYFWVGNEKGTGGVGILSEEWTEKIFDINRVSGRIMIIELAIDNKTIKELSCYAPQIGLKYIIKDNFYYQLQNTIVGTDETLVTCDDLNGQIGKLADD